MSRRLFATGGGEPARGLACRSRCRRLIMDLWIRRWDTAIEFSRSPHPIQQRLHQVFRLLHSEFASGLQQHERAASDGNLEVHR